MLLFCLSSSRGQNLRDIVGNSDELSITADHMEADVEKGVAYAKGKVQIRYGQLTVKANEASLNQDTKDFSAKGDVVVSLDDGSQQSKTIKKNIVNGFRTRSPQGGWMFR